MIDINSEIEKAHMKSKTDWKEVVRLRDLVKRVGAERDEYKEALNDLHKALKLEGKSHE